MRHGILIRHLIDLFPGLPCPPDLESGVYKAHHIEALLRHLETKDLDWRRGLGAVDLVVLEEKRYLEGLIARKRSAEINAPDHGGLSVAAPNDAS